MNEKLIYDEIGFDTSDMEFNDAGEVVSFSPVSTETPFESFYHLDSEEFKSLVKESVVEALPAVASVEVEESPSPTPLLLIDDYLSDPVRTVPLDLFPSFLIFFVVFACSLFLVFTKGWRFDS